jgi:energy-coupling factor transporter ATP-binding protein EcfA2
VEWPGTPGLNRDLGCPAIRNEGILVLSPSQAFVVDDQSQSVEDGGYLMINRLELRNFRCFKQLDISLKQFNVIVGESASGKTALMEALFLLGGGSPEIYFRLRNWRGFSRTLSLSGTRESYQSLFRDLFYNFDQNAGAILESQDSSVGSRKLEISYGDSKEYGLDLQSPEPHAFMLSPLNFKWVVEGRVHNTSIFVKEGRFTIEGSAPVAALAYYNSVNTTSFETSSAFSSLSRSYRSTSLVKVIAAIYPQVKDVTLELIGGDPTLCVATDLQERLPLGDLSGGVTKFVSIALGILANPGGTVIVDEIESGFYYKDMPAVWFALVNLCLDEKVQLVVSTHSYEFLKAAAPILAKEGIAKESQLMRSEINADGERVIKKIAAHSFESATSLDFEVR